MKKFLFIIAAAAAVLACDKAITVEDPINEPVISNEQVVPAAQQIAFTATLEGATKATLSAADDFSWETTDRAAVYSNEGEIVVLTPSAISGATATFTGTLTSGTDFIPEGAIVVYPAERLTASGKVTFPATYDQFNETQAGPTLAAKVASKTLAFKYLAGTIKFTINNVPKIVTSTVINVRSAADDADVVCTGTYDIDFSGDTPALTNAASTGSTVTIGNGSYGNGTITLPLPTNGAQMVKLAVKYVDDVLFAKSVTLSSTHAVTRNFFAAMPALTINPTVYLISDFTHWTYSEPAEVLSGSGRLRTSTLTASTTNKYYRYLVDYGTVQVDMGPDADGSTSLDEDYTPNTNAAKLSDYGVYTFSFDFVSGANNVSALVTVPQIYLTGSFQTPSAWVLDEGTPLEMVNETEGYKVMHMDAASTVKAYTNCFWSTAFPGSNVYLGDENYYLFAANGEAGTLTAVYLNNAPTATAVTLNGTINSWAGEAMTQVAGTPAWYIDVDWSGETYVDFKFVVDGTWKDATDPAFSSVATTIESGNIRVPGGEYRIFVGDDTAWAGWALFSLN